MVAVTCCAGIAAGSSRIAKARGATRIANLRLLEWQGGSGERLHDASRTDMTMGPTTVGRKLAQVKYESQARTHEGDGTLACEDAGEAQLPFVWLRCAFPRASTERPPGEGGVGARLL